MKKKFFAAVLILAMALQIFPALTLAAETAVYINGEKVVFNEESGRPFVENGRTLVPLRRTMEAFGAEVIWDSETRSAIVRKAPVTVLCTIDENCIYRNGVALPNDAAAVIRNGRTYLPIRAVLEAFGAEVTWDGGVKVTTAEGRFVSEIESNGTRSETFWNNYNAANNHKAAGNYASAVAEYRKVAYKFVTKEQNQSKAMLFLNMGDCYSALGQYENARMCYLREAYYWNLSGDLQSEIAANRRASLISGYTQVYVKTYNPDYSVRKHYGLPYETESGIFVGACVPVDQISSFGEKVGKEHGAFLQYMEYGASLYSTVEGIPSGTTVQIHLQPMNGLDQVAADDYLINLAKQMSGGNYMLRFAGEMNDTSNPHWYDPDPSKFIRAFRTVADVFHEYAPNVPVIWAPNFYPETNYADYYPGDEYVDYVGVSSYKTFLGEVDPLGEEKDRSRWSSQLDTLYALYGHKKPFMVVEGNAAHTSYRKTEDKTDFAVEQIKDFFTYAPMRYPNLKTVFIYDNRDYNENYDFYLSMKPMVLQAYREVISSPIYRCAPGYDETVPSYYELCSKGKVEACVNELCAYIVYPTDSVSYVVYRINGEDKGVAYGMPYAAQVDFSQYKGQSVMVDTLVFNASGAIISQNSAQVNVQ